MFALKTQDNDMRLALARNKSPLPWEQEVKNKTYNRDQIGAIRRVSNVHSLEEAVKKIELEE